MKQQRIATQVARVPTLVILAGVIGAGLTGSIATAPSVSDTLAQRQHSGRVTETAQAAVAAIAAAARDATPAPMVVAQAAAAQFNFKVDRQYDQLRDKLRWLPVRLGSTELKTPDAQSRLLLAQSAAQRADLAKVGLSYRDVYGIINAETSWIPRMVAS